MALANTLAQYDMAVIAAIISFIVQTPGVMLSFKFLRVTFIQSIDTIENSDPTTYK
jgi:hypothetical protein